MAKTERRKKILEFIESRPIVRQEDIAAHLIECGYPATQATVSRDIRSLGLVKQRIDGVVRYVQPQNLVASDTSQKLAELFSNCVVEVDIAKNLVVIKTLSGMAQGAASAIDALHSESIVGCIAGDDTIMVILRTDADAEHMQQRFLSMIK